MSDYLDKLTGNRMSDLFRDWFPMHVSFLALYADFFSFFMVLVVSILLAIGVKESSILNKIFTTINLATVILIIGSGAMKCKQFEFSFLFHQIL